MVFRLDIFFAIDIVLTFFVACIDSRTQLLVRNPRKIRCFAKGNSIQGQGAYCCGWAVRKWPKGAFALYGPQKSHILCSKRGQTEIPFA
ncbi:Potassium channel AKT2 [Apostasia shenzhenica]|uniref:Potassium channel AKT2 n=1 Tax=Apostasia shenzhenica TaxID=1088818 RepID=A0A2H9ZXD7_9ASPA|nr:Potassium channel AKT2 [Apostasia shenzhenica]